MLIAVLGTHVESELEILFAIVFHLVCPPLRLIASFLSRRYIFILLSRTVVFPSRDSTDKIDSTFRTFVSYSSQNSAIYLADLARRLKSFIHIEGRRSRFAYEKYHRLRIIATTSLTYCDRGKRYSLRRLGYHKERMVCTNPALMTVADMRLSAISRWQCASGCMGTNDKHLSNICSEVLTTDPALVSRLESLRCIFSHSL